MKNIFVLPSDKPSRLWINNLLQGKLELEKEILIGSNTAAHVYITNSEEIKENTQTIKQGLNGDYFYNTIHNFVSRVGDITRYDFKVVLTTDPELIKNGVQSIDDDFLEWFVKNPSCGFVEVDKKYITPCGDIVETCYDNENPFYVPIIPQPKQETIEEVAQEQKDNFAIGFAEWKDNYICEYCNGDGYTVEVEAECCRQRNDYCCGVPNPIQVQKVCYCNGITTEELLQIYKSQL